ncbi:antibiotic biosynthesis monooxygenase [Luteimonas sp. SJ-92]|uniref:Antibiotic biosynthesis monooxygenase n=1 Tax=Luteimonas salinisoli TaxID=2752307 RepID=A0A853JFT1_9GAMM|nr:antibiotic biosynthesis monooxygenase [Luteimonas salinisoli]NZA28196.1 antibiotic biosynthesis monooxygenase [Luteimonas salinisoli]
MFVIIWQYQVRPGAEDAFRALHGPQGGWATLFREYAGYLGTELLVDTGTGPWVTIDRWDSEAAYAACLEASREAYARIDAEGDALTEHERCLGRYRTPC